MNKRKIKRLCKKYGIKNYTINEDASIDVDGNVYLNNYKLTKLPLKFRNVSGNFSCFNNQLTSLEGCPKSVGGDFNCSVNKLTSLEGCSKSVGSNFFCVHNKLTSLEGCPEKIYGIFNCYDNKLTSLEGCPELIGDNIFYCDYIEEVKDYLVENKCYDNYILDLEYNKRRKRDELLEKLLK